MNRLASLTACLCVYLGLAVGYGADTPAKEQPVYVYLYTRIDDHVNHELSEDRVKRTIANLDRIGRANPGVTPSCVFLVSGASSEMFQQRDDAAKYLTTLKEGVRRGVWEIGYDGENEPTHLVRPQPNFRGAKTGDDRWMARTQAFGWFLNEYKHRLTGEPDPSRPGGLKLTQQVMGPVVSVSGVVTMELGSDSEAANLIRQQAPGAILPGLPESDTWPARNLDGYWRVDRRIQPDDEPGSQFCAGSLLAGRFRALVQHDARWSKDCDRQWRFRGVPKLS